MTALQPGLAATKAGVKGSTAPGSNAVCFKKPLHSLMPSATLKMDMNKMAH